MKISKLELKRFIKAYIDYKTSDDTTLWLNNKNYLQYNEFEFTDTIENLIDHEVLNNEIIEIMKVLGVEVV